MRSLGSFLAFCAGAAVLAAGCIGGAGGSAPADAASKAEVQALEKRVADLEGKVGALAAAPKAGGTSAVPVAPALPGALPTIGIPNDKGKEVLGCVKVDKGLAVTGKLDAPQWKKAKQAQLVSDEGKRLACDSLLAVCHDTENLYVATVCMESQMDKIKATCKKRDEKVYADDCVEYYIDAKRAGDQCVKLVVNADGVFMDFNRQAHGDGDDVTLSGPIKAARLADRYVIEMAIPFKDLGVTYKPGLEINFNAYRMRTVNGESSTWWGECNKLDTLGKLVLE